MIRRTPKAKARYPRNLHERRGRLKRKRNALRRWMKSLHATDGPSELLNARRDCHVAFDLLWCGPQAPLTRQRAYDYLRRITGMSEADAHIAMFDRGLCDAVAMQVRTDYPHLFTKSH